MRRAALLALTIAASIASPMRVEAKAHFMDLPAAVADADAVAVVQVETSEKVTGQKKGYWTYGQRNTFRFLELVKRAPFVEPVIKERQILWGEKDFVCESESFRPGLYLLFLESIERGEWVSTNHYRGVLPIEQNTVAWPYAERRDAVRTVDQAKAAVARAKATHGSVRFTAEIFSSLNGVYNRWIASRSHQVLVFDLHGKAPSPGRPSILSRER